MNDEGRWAAFTPAERDELGLSLDHRFAEAENGNAYVYSGTVGSLLLELTRAYPDEVLCANETIEDVEARIVELKRRKDSGELA